MPHRTVAIVWVAGIVLAAAAYMIGPDDFVRSAFLLFDRAAASLQAILQDVGARAYDVLRAMAIGLFAIFFALSLVAVQRGLAARWTLLVITLVFMVLVWHEGPEASGHWTLAFLLAAAGAASVTRRLMTHAPAIIDWHR